MNVDDIRHSDGFLVVKCFADWCFPCKTYKPIFEKFKSKYGDKANFIEVNIEEDQEFAVEFGISSIPYTLFFKDGELVNGEIGLLQEHRFELIMKDFLGDN